MRKIPESLAALDRAIEDLGTGDRTDSWPPLATVATEVARNNSLKNKHLATFATLATEKQEVGVWETQTRTTSSRPDDDDPEGGRARGLYIGGGQSGQGGKRPCFAREKPLATYPFKVANGGQSRRNPGFFPVGTVPDGWWTDLHEERAAVLEFNHELPKAKAERLAYEGCVAGWLNANPPPIDPDHCVCCGEPLPADGGDAVPVPRGEDVTTHVWVRRGHYERWLHQRRAEAKAALAAAGLSEP